MAGINKQSILIKDFYREVIGDIMKEHNIPKSDPGYVLPPDAEFEKVVQYTHWYVVNPQGQERHHRYRRYRRMLDLLQLGKGRKVHVDVGCGAGLFSWAFLDWATENDIAHKHVRLFGYDHNLASLRLARRIRTRVKNDIPSYPKLRYNSNVGKLLSRLEEDRPKNSDYVITFGFVLVQAQSKEEIELFAKIISHVARLVGPRGSCSVVAVDAISRGTELDHGWSSLLRSLGESGVSHKDGLQWKGYPFRLATLS